MANIQNGAPWRTASQPPMATTTSRTVAAATTPSTLPEPWLAKYRHSPKPKNANPQPAPRRNSAVAARTCGSDVKMRAHRSGSVTATTPISMIRHAEMRGPRPGDAARAGHLAGPDRHADHRHAGGAEREGDRDQQELEPHADAVAGQRRRAVARDEAGGDQDRQHRLHRRQAGDRADLEDVDEHLAIERHAGKADRAGGRGPSADTTTAPAAPPV